MRLTEPPDASVVRRQITAPDPPVVVNSTPPSGVTAIAAGTTTSVGTTVTIAVAMLPSESVTFTTSTPPPVAPAV